MEEGGPSELTLPSFAKINWRLRVIGKRPDGYHELCTVFQTVSLHDVIRFEKSDETVLKCSDPAMPTDGRNLIMKAAAALRAEGGAALGASMVLEKNIPASGGLGGGSSNAAIALIGLSKLWNLSPAAGDLARIARGIGADVPFFLTGGTALGTGRGDAIEPLDEISEPLMMIVTPRLGMDTASAFSALNAQNLTTSTSESNLVVCRREARNLRTEQGDLVNDLEEAVVKSHPEIAEIKGFLKDCGARVAQMSGSGSSVFAVFDKEETRQATLEASRKLHWRMFAVATLSRSQYREALNPCHGLLPISF